MHTVYKLIGSTLLVTRTSRPPRQRVGTSGRILNLRVLGTEAKPEIVGEPGRKAYCYQEWTGGYFRMTVSVNKNFSCDGILRMGHNGEIVCVWPCLHATLSEVIHVQKLGRMAHRRMLAGRGIMGEITIRQRQVGE